MPSLINLHVDQLLSNVSVKYQNQQYFADKIFPVVQVKKTTDVYRTYTRDWRIPDTIRANRGESKEADFEVSSATYMLERHAIKGFVSDTDKDNYDQADYKADMTEHLTDLIMRRRESMVAALFTTANWSLQVSLATANVWTLQSTTANPIIQIDTAATTIINQSGMKPNFMWVRRDGFTALKNNMNVLDRTKYTSAEMTESILAALLGVESLYVVSNSYDTSKKGRDDSITSIWPNAAFVGYKPASPGPLKPSCGYTFEKNIPRVKVWRDEPRECDVIEVNMELVPKVVASLCGYLITGPV